MRPRRRVGLPHGLPTTAGQKLMALVAVALLYGGGVVLALGAGVAPADLEAVTGYRTVYDALAGLDPAGWSVGVRVAVAAGGLLGALLLLRLGWAQRLLPSIGGRDGLTLPAAELPGRTTVSARAIERAAEIAAGGLPGVQAVKASLGEGEIRLAVHARSTAALPELLRGAQERVRTSLAASGTPQDSVRVVVTRVSTPSTRELR